MRPRIYVKGYVCPTVGHIPSYLHTMINHFKLPLSFYSPRNISALLSLSSIGLKDWSFFAVFDGHAGSKVSKHCAEHLLDSICATDDFKKAIKNNSSSSTDPLSSSAATSTTSSNNDSNNDPKNVPLTSSASSTAGSIEDIVTVVTVNNSLTLFCARFGVLCDEMPWDEQRNLGPS